MKRVGFIGLIARAASLCAGLLINAHANPGDWSGQGPFGGSITALQADPLVPTRLYASTTNGFFRSDDAGVSWASAETGLLVAHPENGVFAVSPNAAGGLWTFDDVGRLYSSSDGGNNWLPTGYTTGTMPNLSANALAQGSGNTVWYAANTAGLLVSTDNGVTFNAASGGFPAGQTVTMVATNPHDTQSVIAGTALNCNAITGVCPVYFSSDGGGTWSPAAITGAPSLPGSAQRPSAIAFGPGTNVYALYSPGAFNQGVLLSSTDNGANWTAHAQFGSALAASPSNALTVWVDANKSTNGGNVFTPLATSGRTTNGAFVPSTSAIAVSANYPSTPRVWIGTQYAGMYLSNDDGATWASSNDGMAATNIRSVIVHPADNARLFAGYGDAINDPSQAFFRSTSTGTWTVSNSGLKAWQLRTVLIDPTTAGTIGSTVMYAVGSGFDTAPRTNNRNSGIYKSADGGLTWTTQEGGIPVQGTGHYAGALRTIIADPRSCASPPLDGSACTTGPLLTLYVTGGGRVGVDPAPGTGTHAFPHPYRVMKSTDGGANWTDSSTGLPDDLISDLDCTFDSVEGVTPIVMDPSDSNILYIGTFAGASDAACKNVTPQVASGVYKSINAGASWTLMSNGLPTYTGSAAVLDTLSLAIDAANPQTLWVSTIDNGFNPAAPGQIYKTTNGGANWSVSNAGVSGPDVRALLADPSNPGTLYAASGGLGPANPGGVYKSTDGGANWMSISVGLPSFSATALTLDPVDPSVLYAGTNGGVYSIVQLPDADADGVPDLIENSGPNGGDANQDSSQDSGQTNVGTTAPGLFGGFGWQQGIANATQTARTTQLQQKLQMLQKQQTTGSGIQGGYFTVQVGGGCSQAVDVQPINPGPLGLDTVAHHGTYTYPRGLLRFELPQCSSAAVDIMFNAATFGPGWSWRYYGPSVPGDNSTMGWHDAKSLVVNQIGVDWSINLTAGAFGSYRPAGTNSILFEGGPAYNDTVFSDNFQ
jgi:photosystem II stability/assembly factor-like uncharacterized protein